MSFYWDLFISILLFYYFLVFEKEILTGLSENILPNNTCVAFIREIDNLSILSGRSDDFLEKEEYNNQQLEFLKFQEIPKILSKSNIIKYIVNFLSPKINYHNSVNLLNIIYQLNWDESLGISEKLNENELIKFGEEFYEKIKHLIDLNFGIHNNSEQLIPTKYDRILLNEVIAHSKIAEKLSKNAIIADNKLNDVNDYLNKIFKYSKLTN